MLQLIATKHEQSRGCDASSLGELSLSDAAMARDDAHGALLVRSDPRPR